MKKAWTVRLAFALIVAAVLDIVSTYIATPDLSGEANPVLVMFGRTWTYIVVFKVVGALLAVVVFAGGLQILQTRVDRLKGITGFVNVIGRLTYKRQVSLVEVLLYGWPKDWIAVLAIGGITLGTIPVTGGITAAILNTFKAVRSQAQLMTFWIGTGALGISIALWLTYRFLVKQRKAEYGDEVGAADGTPQGHLKAVILLNCFTTDKFFYTILASNTSRANLAKWCLSLIISKICRITIKWHEPCL